MLITAFLLIPQTWKQPKCSLVDEWPSKLWYSQRIEFFSMLKRYELSSHKKIWRKLKALIM
jgi:hypothetical protein